MLPFRPEAGQADEQLGRQLWAGVPGVDYTEATRWKTPLNSDNLTVVHDKTATINPEQSPPGRVCELREEYAAEDVAPGEPFSRVR